MACLTIHDMKGCYTALEQHCRESTFIMRAFAKDWYGKTYAEKAIISNKKVQGFIGIALNKIVNEFTLRGQNV